MPYTIREALEATQHWLQEEAARPGETSPDEILRVIGEALAAPVSPAITALQQAESFIAGFEDDELQDGIPELLATIRSAKVEAEAAPAHAMIGAKWTADECLSSGGFVTIRPSDGTPNGDTEAHPIATVYDHAHGPVVAAAPDLLAALRALLLQNLQSGVVFERDCCVAQARAAIAKAEGRSS